MGTLGGGSRGLLDGASVVPPGPRLRYDWGADGWLVISCLRGRLRDAAEAAGTRSTRSAILTAAASF
jgi:hypothetical protein